MQIIKDNTFSRKLQTNLARIYGKKDLERTREVHVSDLVLCPLQSYFRKVDPKQPSFSDLVNYCTGNGYHQRVQWLAGTAKEIKKQWRGSSLKSVYGTIDILYSKSNTIVPIELKTTKTQPRVRHHYLRQLIYYCIMLNSDTGILLILSTPPYGERTLVEFVVTLTEDDIAEWTSDLDARKNAMEKALDSSAVSELLRYKVMGTDEEWLCRSCPYYDKCVDLGSQPIRETVQEKQYKSGYA